MGMYNSTKEVIIWVEIFDVFINLLPQCNIKAQKRASVIWFSPKYKCE